MRRTLLVLVVPALLLSALVLSARGSEADELRERVAALRKEAAALAQQGKKEEAERVMARARELLEQASRRAGAGRREGEPGPDARLAALQHELEQLRAQARKLEEANAPAQQRERAREAIARVEQQLHEVHAGRAGGPPHELADAHRRLQHLRVAAENLRAAGIPDAAASVTEQANNLEREIRQAQERWAAQARPGMPGGAMPGGPGPAVEALTAQVRELRQEVERLRADVERLKQMVAQKHPGQ